MSAAPNTQNLDHYWMPFTANRQFKTAPRMLESAQGMYYRDADGNQILDGAAGLWCVNAGHGRPEITEAVARQLERLDYCARLPDGPSRRVRIRRAAGGDRAGRRRGQLDRVFFTNSRFGSGGHRAQDRAGLSARHRPGHPHPPDRTRARLSRRGLRRHFGGRAGQQPPDVPASAGRRSSAPHPRSVAQSPSRAACPSMAPSWPTIWNGWWRCMAPRPSPR